MSPVYPTLPKLAVRDSFDDEDLSDVDDEVFIRDGRNGGLKIDDEGGVKRPLMAPRRKCKMTRPRDRRRMNCRALLAPCCYGSVALLVLLGLITLVIFAVSVFPVPLNFLKSWLTQSVGRKVSELDIAACTSLGASTVWTRSLPKLMSESPLRSVDVNGDKIDDVIVSFSTGLNKIDAPQYVCNVYFGGQKSCLAGVLALDGATGETLWTYWSWHVIFSLNCALDLNGDGIRDCVGAGRGGTLCAISGRNGSAIWTLPQQDSDKTVPHRILDVYDANYIADVDGDEVADVLAAHTVQIGIERSSSIVFISGKTGSVIRKLPIDKNEQLYLAPQILVHPDGEKIFVLVTGSHKQSGGLFVAPFSELLNGELKLQELYRDSEKGVLSQPILADITGDGTEDIIAAMYNSVIVAYNGRTFEQIWNYTVPNSEVISSPIPGYYNDDDVPDFMVKHQLGPGFPVYYYTVAMIVDGKNGKPLLENELVDSMSGQLAGLSVTVDGYGNDWFLHWSADCLNHEGEKSAYEFLKTTSLTSETGADLCKLRFNSTLTTKFLALSQHTAPPGLPLYVSEKWKKLEYNSSIDPRKEAEKYSEMHPNYERVIQETGVSSITERSLRVRPKQRSRVSNSRVGNGENIFADQTGFYPNSNGLNSYRKDNAVNYPETNVSDDFGSDEDWRDNNKWDDENKDYNVLYEEGENQNQDIDKVNGIREQRSGSIENKKINNDTNNVKNELDLSMDYTNGQAETKNYHSPSLASNGTINLDESEPNYPEVSDFDFEESSSDPADSVQIKTKRETEAYENNSGHVKGQEEIGIENFNNGKTYEPFFKVDKRPKNQSVFEKHDNESRVEGNVSEIVELHPPVKKSYVNLSTIDFNELRNNSNERSDAGLKIFAENVDNKNETERIILAKKLKSQDSWPTRDIFNKVKESNEEDANIEKIFKRESMKNRRIMRSNKITASDKLSRTKMKSKREAIVTTSDSQSENFDGVQRQPPTGILLPSLTKSEGTSNSIDLIFSTSWLPPSDASVILLQQDLDCIHRKRKESQSSSSRGKKEQKDRAEIVLECLSERGVDYKRLEEGSDRENVKIPLGQMTVYRMKLECVCPEDMLEGQTCRKVSPQQSWPEHLGPLTNGYFKPMKKPAT